MKKVIYLIVFLLTNLGLAQDQKITAHKKNEILLKADDFIGFDGLGNYFYIENEVLYKNVDNTILQYQNLALGKINKVDIFNPLKVAIFYKDFNTVVFLDNLMNEIQRIEFSRLQTPTIATAIGISGQNRIWVFNSINQQIGLYDITNNSYQNLAVPIQNEFDFYQTDFNYFHWINNKNQWYTCSIFGRVFTNGIVEERTNLQLIETNKIMYSKNQIIYIKDLMSNKTYEIVDVEKSFKKIFFKDQILSIFTDKRIINYKITLP